MTDNELLLILSDMLEKKLQPIKDDTRNIHLSLENDIVPRLQNIESCYTSTYNRYKNSIAQMEDMKTDIDVIKSVLKEHSEKLQIIS